MSRAGYLATLGYAWIIRGMYVATAYCVVKAIVS